ncbi:fatty acid oxidation complex subunit alpha FadB [soil metagenome]
MANAFQLEDRDDGIAVLTFDLPGKSVNTLGQDVLKELGGLVEKLSERSDLRGLLLRSAKPKQFVAGANLRELGMLAFIASKEQIAEALELGHGIFRKISQLPFPTVALIDGNCMGGGTELALSMDDRIVSEAPHTKIALPEVQLGLIPAWGGTQRLPRLIGLNAIEVICTGENLNAEKAASLGLAFDAVPAESLLDEGIRRIEMLHQEDEWKERRKRAEQPLGLSTDARTFAFATAEGFIKGKTKGQYPAPLLALKSIKEGTDLPLEQGLEVEKRVALELFGSPIASNLISLFFVKQRLGKDPGVDDEKIQPAEIRRVGVLGAGLMGAGIATAHARSGIPTVMVDVADDRLADGMRRAREMIDSRIKIGRATPEDMADMLSFLGTSTSQGVFADRDLVVEAVTEDEAVKTEMYRKLAEVLPKDAILATNTSTISISRMATAAPDPKRFVGMHFFYPVDRMELVEVIRGNQTSDETVAATVALAKRIRKTPIVVKDCPGFLVNRVLFPYMNEALLMLLEGAEMDEIDEAATRFGMPMGPIALQDLVGLDTAALAGGVLAKAFPDRAVSIPLVEEMVKAGRLGQKSGAGCRKYTGKKCKPEPDAEFAPMLAEHRTGDRSPDREEITDRLFLPMLLEATRVVEEGIVREPADADMGLILGTGFPPFRGGILRWADTEGAENLLKRLEKYQSLGKRFEPTEILKRHVRKNELFYPPPKIPAWAKVAGFVKDKLGR